MERIKISVGEKVIFNNNESIIVRIINLDEVTIEEINSNILRTVKVNELRVFSESNKSQVSREVHALTTKELLTAKQRFDIIEPILNDRKNLDLIKELAKRNKVHFTTIYRWLKTYDENGTVSSLVRKRKLGGKGKSRLNPRVEQIITDSIQDVYLNSSKKSITKVIRSVIVKCKKTKLAAPHPNTIRSRLNSLSEEDVLRKRYGQSVARYKFEAIKSHFPGANHPLSIVQIDHTKLDIILVDEHYRKSFLRPWLTLAMDVYSRMVVGFYLSFDPPGEMGTGLCLANSILPKEDWLQKHNIESSWPCWGVMKTIHLDNAKEFRGKMLTKACLNYNINIEFRPVKQPHWGGHIERLLGTFSKEIHNLPGTTFSTLDKRVNYNSEKKASLTISELEKWLLIYIVEVYHKRKHSSIHMSPLQKLKDGILGNGSVIGTGQFPRIVDERRLKLDFMPYVERTVQEYGVVIDHIFYYDEVLRKYIHSQENRMKRKFLFRRDPRDISIIYFYEPELNEYYEIPYRDTSKPPMSIWEFNNAVKKLNENNVEVDEDAIFTAYEQMEEIELNAIKQTKRLKRTSRYADKRNLLDIKPSNSESPTHKGESSTKHIEIKPFDDIDHGPFTS